MSAPTLRFYDATNSTYLDLNDGTTYTVMPGVDMGANQKTWDERVGYTGAIAQYNVTGAHLIDVTVPLLVKSTSAANLRAAIGAINTQIDSIAAGTTQLIYDGTTYHLMESQRVGWVEDKTFLVAFWTNITLALKRNTTVA